MSKEELRKLARRYEVDEDRAKQLALSDLREVVKAVHYVQSATTAETVDPHPSTSARIQE